jgi:adhesin/invasin
VAGTATTIGATIGGAPVTSTLPGITVIPGAISTATSLVTVSAATVASGTAVTLSLQAKDAAGNNLITGGAVVAFTASGGTSTGVISATTDHNDGTYTATFTGVLAGTAATIGATIGGTAVTSTL